MRLATLLLLLMFAPSVSATVFYVDSAVTDTNVASATPDFTAYNPATFATTGGSASVHKTIADINAKTLSAGDQVLFRKGQIWRELLLVPSSGSSGNPIIFGSFGSGAKPIIKASDLVTGFTSEVVGAFTAYYKVISGSVPNKQVFQNEVRLQQVAAKASLVVGSFFWDAGNTRAYIRTSGDDDPAGHTIEWSARGQCITVGATTNITVQDLELAHARSYNITAGTTNITIQRNTTHNAFINNIEIGSVTAFTNTLIYENDVYEAGGSGISAAFNFIGLRIERNDVHENSRLSSTLPGGSSEQVYTAGIKLFGGTTDWGADTIIRDNTVWGNAPASWDAVDQARGQGIWLDTLIIPNYATLGMAIVEYNRIYDNESRGIYFEKNQGCLAQYNIIYNNAKNGTMGNLEMSSNSDVDALGPNWAYNNTVYGTGWSALYMGNGTGGDVFTNHVAKNNILWSTTGGSPRPLFLTGTGGDLGAGNVINNNDYGGTFFVGAFNSTYGTTYSTIASWRTASGQDINSIAADPLFTNVGTLDFTLQSGSPAINVGTNLGTAFQSALLTTSTWPNGVVTGNQNSYGAGWEMGAYLFGASGARISMIGRMQGKGTIK